MGFLANLLKGEVKKALSGAADSVSEALSSRSEGFRGRIEAESGERGLRQRLEAVLASEYSNYELRKEIPAVELGAEKGAKSYSYGLYLDGQPIAFMMVMKDRNHYRSREVRLAGEAAAKRGVPYMNFMSHLPNRTEYISNRLRENIKR